MTILDKLLASLSQPETVEFAKWPDSEHIAPRALPAGTIVAGARVSFPIRVMSEDEYQLLLDGFKAAGGKVMQR